MKNYKITVHYNNPAYDYDTTVLARNGVAPTFDPQWGYLVMGDFQMSLNHAHSTLKNVEITERDI